MDELELIKRLTAGLPSNETVIQGAGDDCAVLDLGIPDKYSLYKTDAVVEGVHFTADALPERIGHKALGRCLSDIAAMAGTPVAALITLALPGNFSAERLQKIYEGMNVLARRYNVAIAGGETTSNTNGAGLLLSLTALGTVPKSRCILRSGAKVGDAIFVTGELGGSLSGKHLEFEPRLLEGQWLAENFPIHSMIDLSDGLASDLRHVLDASNVGAELRSASIPISRAAKLKARAESSSKPPLLSALSDGEDFELAFTLPSNKAVAVLDAWKTKFPELKLTCIGKITQEHGLRLRDKDRVQTLRMHGYVHFQQS